VLYIPGGAGFLPPTVSPYVFFLINSWISAFWEEFPCINPKTKKHLKPKKNSGEVFGTLGLQQLKNPTGFSSSRPGWVKWFSPAALQR